MWNIRGVKSRGAFERLKFLVELHKVRLILLQEPFVDDGTIESYTRRIAYDGCYANVNGKIWFIWSSEVEVSIIADEEQQVTIVYAKNKGHLRATLWKSLKICNNYINGPWCITGDFNVIMSSDEKKGENPHIMEKSWDFIECMEECGMADVGYTAPRFTWCNARDKWNRIWKRLDRVFVNHEWTSKTSRFNVEHMASTGSDHTHMLVKYSTTKNEGIKYFKFFKFWTEQPNFISVI
ncbi:uncharacterized protein [Nicotiana tomentosiformis]|uniref:uncharacterized protein n=1 Tax=Nicotiana tomentosiformis TaxID=4098 RepID=UPI00388C8451